MQLTQLEIKGFKSFGDKIVINFDEGITGIVGPNGCGKSNIVDAIRWVLGEQKTKALRSDKMENVIFNGTKNRKPTQLAEVSLTFDNTKNLLPTEYSHITITRRFFRSGDSEYLLNGISCRLKDITNLFLDTGIASNSYAIIELKMVDDILNDKDNSRRGLFEEAAGISKFKIRKKETFKKLEETDEDLNRVEDILFEINKNLKSLEKQARQAEKYFKIKEDYKSASIELAHFAIARHNKSYEQINKKLIQENDNKINLNAQLQTLSAEIEQQKAVLLEKEKLLSSRQKTLNDHVNKIRQFESDKKIRNERLHYFQEKSNSLESQIQNDSQNKEKLNADLKKLHLEEENSIKLLTEAEFLLREFKDDYEKQKSQTDLIQKEVQNLNLEFRQKQEKGFQLQKALEIKEVQLSALKQELEKTLSDASHNTVKINDFEQKIIDINNNLKDSTDRLDILWKNQEELNLQENELQLSIETLKDEHSVINRKLDAKQNEYNLTKSLVDNLEGFPEAIKFLKNNARWGKDAPLLSDIISCDEEYKVAIENYLELYMNYFIVDVEPQAYEAVNILNEASKGKAYFFILDSFKSFLPSPSIDYPHSVAARNIVEYDPKYAPLINYILDGVYISDSGIQNIPEDGSDVFISKNGTITKKRFSISGGSVGLFEGKRLGRAKNLEKLEKEIRNLRKLHDENIHRIRVQQETLASLKQENEKAAIEKLQKEINLLNQDYISYKTRYEQFASELNNQQVKKEDILDNIAGYTEELEDLRPKVENERSIQLSLENQIQQINEELITGNNLLAQKSNNFNQQNILFYQCKNKVNNIVQDLEYKKSSLKTTVDRLEKNNLELYNNDIEIKKLLSTSSSSDDDILNLYLEKDAIENGVNEVEKEYYTIRYQIDSLEKETREFQRNKDNIDDLILQLNNKINAVKLDLMSVKERLSVEFGLEYDKDDHAYTSEDELENKSEEELRHKVKLIKEKLEKIGPVNPMAMEAYEEIKSRNDFITAQKEDLIKAKESLLATIAEIDTVARETFLNSFQKIKENFMLVFRSLFTEEDDCDLKISDPQNPLESAIDIIAKPKGKKPLSINQLSGGEKTLTAISLLFAIYLLKPAPFCIFDEVDAPLDDANIDKFNMIIKKFSRESQFIIVTHNKRTMASTDIIYGITMVEQGVSQVVPVDMKALV
ncbi:chromosome segregation protein SMC [soil metagenome]